MESRGAIRKALGFRPAVTQEERAEAERKALTMTRRRERSAAKSGDAQPPPVEPDYRIPEYAWVIGPRPINPDSTQVSDDTMIPTETVDEAFSKAEQFELTYHVNRLIQEEMIRERKEIRYEQYQKLRGQIKAEKEEDERLGRVEDIKREVQRLEAIDRIYQYAQETGEDVSEWFAELGVDTKDGFGDVEEMRLQGMMNGMAPLKVTRSAKARLAGSFNAIRYRRARESVLSQPASIEFEDEPDIPDAPIKRETERPFGLSPRARYSKEEERLPSPRLFNKGPRESKSWKQRFGFTNDGDSERRTSESGSGRGFGFRKDRSEEKRSTSTRKGFGLR